MLFKHQYQFNVEAKSCLTTIFPIVEKFSFNIHMLYDFSVAESKVTIMFLEGFLIKMFKKISTGPFRCQKGPFGANLAISLILPWPLSLPANQP